MRSSTSGRIQGGGAAKGKVAMACSRSSSIVRRAWQAAHPLAWRLMRTPMEGLNRPSHPSRTSPSPAHAGLSPAESVRLRRSAPTEVSAIVRSLAARASATAGRIPTTAPSSSPSSW